jgi:hypothetical protein
VGRSPYQSEKRRKELARLKKQEEKRQRRFNKKNEESSPDAPADGTTPETINGPDAQPSPTTEPEASPTDQGGGQPPQGPQSAQ